MHIKKVCACNARGDSRQLTPYERRNSPRLVTTRTSMLIDTHIYVALIVHTNVSYICVYNRAPYRDMLFCPRAPQ